MVKQLSILISVAMAVLVISLFPFPRVANAHSQALDRSGIHARIMPVDEDDAPAIPKGSELDRDLDSQGIPHEEYDPGDTPTVPQGSPADRDLDRQGIPHNEYED